MKGLPFMVMYITGATRRLRNPGCKGACISCLLLGHLGDPVLWHDSRLPVSGLSSVRFVAGLRRSLRLQYVKKSVNNPSTFAGECMQRRHLTWSARSAASFTAASAVGSAAGSTSGAAPGSTAGCAVGSSERISMLRRNSGFETFPKLGECRALPTSGINRERSTYNNQFEQSLTAT